MNDHVEYGVIRIDVDSETRTIKSNSNLSDGDMKYIESFYPKIGNMNDAVLYKITINAGNKKEDSEVSVFIEISKENSNDPASAVSEFKNRIRNSTLYGNIFVDMYSRINHVTINLQKSNNSMIICNSNIDGLRSISDYGYNMKCVINKANIKDSCFSMIVPDNGITDRLPIYDIYINNSILYFAYIQLRNINGLRKYIIDSSFIRNSSICTYMDLYRPEKNLLTVIKLSSVISSKITDVKSITDSYISNDCNITSIDEISNSRLSHIDVRAFTNITNSIIIDQEMQKDIPFKISMVGTKDNPAIEKCILDLSTNNIYPISSSNTSLNNEIDIEFSVERYMTEELAEQANELLRGFDHYQRNE